MIVMSIMAESLSSVWWIASAALIAPILSLITRRAVPDVVWLLVLGVLIGPHGLRLAQETESVEFLRELGIGFLFLLAGFEVDTARMRARAGRRAAVTWLISAVLATGAGMILFWGKPSAAVVFGIASTSTALGALLPIIKDAGLGASGFGQSVMVHGAWGELLPIMAMALLLSARATWASALVLLLFMVAALVTVILPKRFFQRIPLLGRAFAAASNSTMQTTVRLSVWVLISLMLMAVVLDLDVALGAFAAGLLLSRGFATVSLEQSTEVMHKLEMVGFSLLIPVFFVTSGMAIDVGAVIERWPFLLAFVAGVALFRGVPVFVMEWVLHRNASFEPRQAASLAFFVSTGLPIIVAVTQLAVAGQLISPDTASFMVTGGAITVLVFPYVATRLMRPRSA